MMKIYKLENDVDSIIFDIDSTLYTNKEYAFEQIDCQIREFAKERNCSVEEARKKVADFRIDWAKEHNNQKISLGNLLTFFGIPIEKSIEWRKSLLEPKIFLHKDEKLIEILKILEKNYKLICVTNNPILPARKTLEALEISSFFNNIIGLDTCYKSKPAKEPFLKACELLDTVPSRCVSVGDRYDMDISLPLLLGMSAILVDGVEDVYKLPNLMHNK
jgi:HAD superfamily hydrolase (TIGR01549 family)